MPQVKDIKPASQPHPRMRPYSALDASELPPEQKAAGSTAGGTPAHGCAPRRADLLST